MSGISFYSHQKEVFSRRSIRKRTGMKKIYLAYLLLIILSACGSKNTNSVYLNGEIKGLGNDTLYIYGTDKFYNRMDTLLVKDDKFSATLTTDTLVSTWLQFSDGTEYPLYLNKGDKIKIKGSAAELTSLEITGNAPNEELTAFQKVMKLWENKNIILIEGEKSRLGVGNDLFEKAKSVKRILGPAHNAFDQFDNLLNFAKQQPQEALYLIAMGPTAKPLAYELALSGRQALDIGNLDVEYEWFLQGAKTKVKIA
jgi:hypothetical protein